MVSNSHDLDGSAAIRTRRLSGPGTNAPSAPPVVVPSARVDRSGSASASTSADAGPAGSPVAIRSTRKRRTPSATSHQASTYQWPSDANSLRGVMVRSAV